MGFLITMFVMISIISIGQGMHIDELKKENEELKLKLKLRDIHDN